MADVTPKSIMIGIIVGMIAILGGIDLIVQTRSVEPSVLADDDFSTLNRTLDKYKDLDETVDDFEENIESAEPDFGIFGVINGLINSVWSVLRNIFTSLGFVRTIFSSLYTFLGIPSWVGNLLMSIITIIISFWIFDIVFRR